MLARDSLEHSRTPAPFRRESLERRFMCGLFIHSLVRLAGWGENRNKGEVGMEQVAGSGRAFDIPQKTPVRDARMR